MGFTRGRKTQGHRAPVMIEMLEGRRMLSATVDHISDRSVAVAFERQDGPILTDLMITADTTTETMPSGVTAQTNSVSMNFTISDIVTGRPIPNGDRSGTPA